MWAAADLEDYTFEVVSVGGGYYKILSCYSGKAVTVLGDNIAQSGFTGADSQLWKFVPAAAENSYYIVSKQGNKYLSMDKSSPANHVNVIPSDNGGMTYQQWKLME